MHLSMCPATSCFAPKAIKYSVQRENVTKTATWPGINAMLPESGY
jgi:hypothetical protein